MSRALFFLAFLPGKHPLLDVRPSPLFLGHFEAILLTVCSAGTGCVQGVDGCEGMPQYANTASIKRICYLSHECIHSLLGPVLLYISNVLGPQGLCVDCEELWIIS